ncbi:MAG: EamA family transporter [Candidatus Levyibacteriota bacterium]
MIWLLFAFLTALFESLKDILSKHNLKKIDEYSASLAFRLSFVFLLPYLLFSKIPTLNNLFFIALIFAVPINIATAILYMKALKNSDVSLSIPLTAFTPLFLLITSPLIIHEFPSFLGLLGVLLIVFGSYLLNLQERHKGFFVPFKALLKEKGPRFMLLVAFLWSIGSNFDKIGVLNSSPIFWVIAVNFCSTLILIPIVFKRNKNAAITLPKNLSLLTISLASALSLAFQMTAISLALVSYVISIKRTSILITIILGALVFREKGLKERLIGGIIMIAGIILIAFS